MFFLSFLVVLGNVVLAVEPYLRITEESNGTRVLEIAVRTFRQEKGEEKGEAAEAVADAVAETAAGSGRRVHLVGVSHIGTQAYYEAIQAKLDAMDLVLFEGVGGDREEFLSRDPEEDAGELQPALARAIGLRFQLHAIDYLRPHFVNSDLSPGELLAVFSGGNLDELTPEGLARMEATLETMQGEGVSAQMMRMFLGLIEQQPRFALGVRWALVEILGTVKGDLATIQGLPEDMQEMLRVLLRKRNAVVMRDVREVLAGEDPPGDLAVFYGAAHMHELEERLRAELGFIPEKTEWLPAFHGNLERSGLGRMQQNVLRHVVMQQVRMLDALLSVEDGTDTRGGNP